MSRAKCCQEQAKNMAVTASDGNDGMMAGNMTTP